MKQFIIHGGTSLLAMTLWFAGRGIASAGQGDQVIIVYNSRVPESKGVAEFYAEQRQVPANQIFGFNLTTNDNMSRIEFREALQKPLAKALEDRKLWRLGQETVPASNNKPKHTESKVIESSIRYAVLCYGMPLRIDRDPLLKEEGMEELRPEFRRDEAAVDSELAVLPLLAKKPPLSGPLRNALYLTNAAGLNPTNGLLMVTRLDGPSAIIARSLVEKSLAAERDGLWGRAYFDLRNTSEPGLKLGDDWLRKGAEVCQRLGFETVVEETESLFPAGFPMSHIAIYCGWYSQDVFGPFTLPSVEFVPGAFAYHLHSFSALDLHSRTRGWAGPLLGKGVTATMGTVNEPYLGGTPEISVFLARWVYEGYSFGEAAYSCQPYLSWQTTVVGDPLYRPFGKNPEAQHAMLIQRHSPLVEWSYLRLVNLNLAVGKSAGDMVTLLEQVDLTKQSAVLSEKLAGLYAAQGKPASAIQAAQSALKLDPSPEQKIRLRLTLGDWLAAQHQTEDAYANYQALVQESPDYPDKLAILRKLLPLAQQLKKDADVSKYETEIRVLSPPPKS